MKLIREDIFNLEYTSELNEQTGEKRWYITGVFAEQEQKNRNGRVYPKRILEREMKRYQKKIAEGSAIGELNHPPYPLPDPKQACMRVVEIWQVGNDWHGKALIMEGTEWGDHIIAMLKNGCKLGVSTRGCGSVKMDKNGVAIVQEDFVLNCWDVVLNPSANKAYVNGILESTDYIHENGVYTEKEPVNESEVIQNLDNFLNNIYMEEQDYEFKF